MKKIPAVEDPEIEILNEIFVEEKGSWNWLRSVLNFSFVPIIKHSRIYKNLGPHINVCEPFKF